MGDRKARKRAAEPVPAPMATADLAHAHDAERALGRATVIGLPVACVLTAVIVGVRASVGSALLVLASGALLGTIALLWASVRTLSGDAPLPSDLDAVAWRGKATDALGEQKRRVLRALKDLESEHAIGKIDDADYEAFVARYREEAMAVMRKMDLQVSPARAEAERIARDYIARRGFAPHESPRGPEPSADDGRVVCAGCGTSNEADAAFCKQCGGAMKTAATGAMRVGSGPLRFIAGWVVIAVAGSAFAQGGGRPTVSGSGEPGQGAAAADTTQALPAGHPPTDGSSPHGRAGGGDGMPGVFQPPEDTEQPDATMPPGSISVDLRDADDHPIAGEVVTLGILMNSIAKGDSRKHVQMPTDGRGHAEFTGLDLASGTAYRVSAGYLGGSFAAAPFQLQQAKAMHVVLHLYPVARDIRQAVIVCEATIAAELRDDRIQVEEALTFYNLGRTAWVPDEVHLSLPEGFTAFDAQMTMSDQGVDQSGGAAKLRGTFAPGQHGVQFRFQLPWSGDKDVDFDVGVPPHVAIARVMMPATSQVKLSVAGLPPPEVRRDGQGQSFLVIERRLRPEDPPLTRLS